MTNTLKLLEAIIIAGNEDEAFEMLRVQIYMHQITKKLKA